MIFKRQILLGIKLCELYSPYRLISITVITGHRIVYKTLREIYLYFYYRFCFIFLIAKTIGRRIIRPLKFHYGP